MEKQGFIKIIGLSKKYPSGTWGLKNINLDVKKGEIFGIVGSSGAGKSTLLRCLNGLEKPTEGSIHIGPHEITSKSSRELIPIRKEIGTVFQHYPLFSSRNVFRNIAFALEIHGVSAHEQKARVEELLSIVGLAHKGESYPSQLSGGEKQRVAIARALANNPQILLCDEPTSALDPKTANSILALLQKLNQTMGLTIVIITHQLDVLKKICHRAAVLADGECVLTGDSEQVYQIEGVA